MTGLRAPLSRDSSGTATIELALFAPILAAMLIGLVDISMAYSEKLQLEQIAQRVIEKVQQNGFSTSMETALETEAATAAGTGATADLTYYLECDGARAASFTSGCSDGALVERYIQLDVQKNHTLMIPAEYVGVSNGVMELHGVAGIRIQ